MKPYNTRKHVLHAGIRRLQRERAYMLKYGTWFRSTRHGGPVFEQGVYGLRRALIKAWRRLAEKYGRQEIPRATRLFRMRHPYRLMPEQPNTAQLVIKERAA